MILKVWYIAEYEVEADVFIEDNVKGEALRKMLQQWYLNDQAQEELKKWYKGVPKVLSEKYTKFRARVVSK